MGLALETTLLMLHSMEKITRVQFLNSQAHSVHMEINSRYPASLNMHLSQSCTSSSPQFTSAIGKKKLDSQFHFQKFFKFLEALYSSFLFLAIWSRTLRSAFKTFCLWVDPQTTNRNLLFFLNLGNWELAPLRNVPDSLQWCCVISIQQHWSPVVQGTAML